MSETNLTGLYKFEGKLYRISNTPDGGEITEMWSPKESELAFNVEMWEAGKGFVPADATSAEVTWDGLILTPEESKSLMI